MKPGDLVELVSRNHDKNSKTGIVLSNPEFFGFVDRVFVMWATESGREMHSEEWIDTDQVRVLARISE